MQPVWNIWEHTSLRTLSLGSNSPKHIEQLVNKGKFKYLTSSSGINYLMCSIIIFLFYAAMPYCLRSLQRKYRQNIIEPMAAIIVKTIIPIAK